MSVTVPCGVYFCEDTNQDGEFDLHSGDRVFDQGKVPLTVTQALEKNPHLGAGFEIRNGDEPDLISIDVQQRVSQGFVAPQARQTTPQSALRSRAFGLLLVPKIILGGLLYTYFDRNGEDEMFPFVNDHFLHDPNGFIITQAITQSQDDDDAPDVQDVDYEQAVNYAEELEGYPINMNETARKDMSSRWIVVCEGLLEVLNFDDDKIVFDDDLDSQERVLQGVRSHLELLADDNPVEFEGEAVTWENLNYVLEELYAYHRHETEEVILPRWVANFRETQFEDLIDRGYAAGAIENIYLVLGDQDSVDKWRDIANGHDLHSND